MEKKKKYLILGIIILLALGGVTVAYLTWSSNKINIGLNSDCFTIDYTKGGDINNASVKLMNESDLINSNNKFTIKEGIALTYANIGIKSTCGIEGYGSLYLNITSLSDAFTTGNSVGALKYAILKNTSTSTVSVTDLLNQSFDIEKTGTITSTGTKKILTKQLSNTEINKYIIVIYIDNNKAGNDVIGSTFSGKISASANQGTAPMGVATEYITNLYTEASKEEVTNNSITYNKAPSVNLMNDRLGGTTSDLDGGNIRYYGASPNNYVYFNCSDYNNQTSDTCEVWRMIGVFDGKVKLIRNTSIGKTLGWTTNRSNDWSQSSMKTYLNGDYYSTLVNDTTRNLIVETTWNLGGGNGGYPNVAYVSERSDTKCSSCTYDTTWTGKIALAYPSDYGYAAEFGNDYCDQRIYDYDNCVSNNWINAVFVVDASSIAYSYPRWLLSPRPSGTRNAFYVEENGSLAGGNPLSAAGIILPTLHLNSDVEFKVGDGSSSNPYQLSA